jgi:hypothetical protein
MKIIAPGFVARFNNCGDICTGLIINVFKSSHWKVTKLHSGWFVTIKLFGKAKEEQVMACGKDTNDFFIESIIETAFPLEKLLQSIVDKDR